MLFRRPDFFATLLPHSLVVSYLCHLFLAPDLLTPAFLSHADFACAFPLLKMVLLCNGFRHHSSRTTWTAVCGFWALLSFCICDFGCIVHPAHPSLARSRSPHWLRLSLTSSALSDPHLRHRSRLSRLLFVTGFCFHAPLTPVLPDLRGSGIIGLPCFKVACAASARFWGLFVIPALPRFFLVPAPPTSLFTVAPLGPFHPTSFTSLRLLWTPAPFPLSCHSGHSKLSHLLVAHTPPLLGVVAYSSLR